MLRYNVRTISKLNCPIHTTLTHLKTQKLKINSIHTTLTHLKIQKLKINSAHTTLTHLKIQKLNINFLTYQKT